MEKHEWLTKLHEVECWFTDRQAERHRVLFMTLSTALGASVQKITGTFCSCLISFCEKLADVLLEETTSHPDPHPGDWWKDWCEKMTKAPVRPSDTTREPSLLCCTAQLKEKMRRFLSNPNRRSEPLCDLSGDWFTFTGAPFQTSPSLFQRRP